MPTKKQQTTEKPAKKKTEAAEKPAKKATAKSAAPKAQPVKRAKTSEKPAKLKKLPSPRSQKSFIVKPHEAKHEWFILDAKGKTLGRLASEIAKILRGKHKPTFTTFSDAGDGVIVINAEKVRVTGAKEAQKIYRYHTGAMSGMREIPYRTMLARKPTYIIEHAVKGMMPQSRLAEAQIKRLRVFAGEEHEMHSQKPIKVNI